MELIGRKDPVSVGRLYEFRCQSVGARPAPHITWWRGSIQLRENVTSRVSTKILGLNRARIKIVIVPSPPASVPDFERKIVIVVIVWELGLLPISLGGAEASNFGKTSLAE